MYTFLALNCFYMSENLKHRLIDSFYILNLIAEYECKFIVFLIYMSSSLPLVPNRKSLLSTKIINTDREYVVRLYEQIKEAAGVDIEVSREDIEKYENIEKLKKEKIESFVSEYESYSPFNPSTKAKFLEHCLELKEEFKSLDYLEKRMKRNEMKLTDEDIRELKTHLQGLDNISKIKTEMHKIIYSELFRNTITVSDLDRDRRSYLLFHSTSIDKMITFNVNDMKYVSIKVNNNNKGYGITGKAKVTNNYDKIIVNEREPRIEIHYKYGVTKPEKELLIIDGNKILYTPESIYGDFFKEELIDEIPWKTKELIEEKSLINYKHREMDFSIMSYIINKKIPYSDNIEYLDLLKHRWFNEEYQFKKANSVYSRIVEYLRNILSPGKEKASTGGRKTKRKMRRNKKTLKKKQFLYNPNDPKKSFDVYIDKNPKDTIPIKYTTVQDVKNTIEKLENLYKKGIYPHKRIWQVGMILKVRLEAMLKHKNELYPNAKNVKNRFSIANKYFSFLSKRSKEKDDKKRKLMRFV